MTDSAAKRQAAERRGRRAEWLAALSLRLKGYRILDRNVRYKAGEIDLIAVRNRVLVFVEVKARSSVALAAAAVTLQAQGRILRASQIWAGQRPRYAAYGHRFDIVAVVPRRWPVQIRDVWRG